MLPQVASWIDQSESCGTVTSRWCVEGQDGAKETSRPRARAPADFVFLAVKLVMAASTSAAGMLLPIMRRVAAPLATSRPTPFASTSQLGRRRALNTTSRRLAADKSTTTTVPIALISQIRAARPGTPLSLARSALVASSNDVPAALAWIQAQAASTGAKKAEKLAGRTANEGLVGVVVLSDGMNSTAAPGLVRAAMVEVRCETDFVARTDEFRTLVESVARSVAFFAEPSPSTNAARLLDTLDPSLVADSPVVTHPASSIPTDAETHQTHAEDIPPATIASTLAGAISRLGENISLARVARIALEPVSVNGVGPLHFASTYMHGAATKSGGTGAGSGGGSDFQAGSLASLLVCRFEPASGSATGAEPTGPVAKVDKAEVSKLARALARQVVAVPTTSVSDSTLSPAAAKPAATTEGGDDEPSSALYNQPLMTLSPNAETFVDFEAGSTSVGDVLNKWSHVRGGAKLDVVDLERWTVGQESR